LVLQRGIGPFDFAQGRLAGTPVAPLFIYLIRLNF
jgi:hypothetical protein